MEVLRQGVDYGIIGVLLALSIWAMAVAVERWQFYKRLDLAGYPDRQTLEISLTKRLVVIGTIAANAPYIGLLGTVLGIMLTFHTMGTSGTMAIATISLIPVLIVFFTAQRHFIQGLVISGVKG